MSRLDTALGPRSGSDRSRGNSPRSAAGCKSRPVRRRPGHQSYSLRVPDDSDYRRHPGRGGCNRTLALTLVYVLGLALVYSVLGLLAGLSGTLFGSVSSSPWALLIMGNLLLVFGLGLLDVFTLGVPSRVAGWAGRIGGNSIAG